MKKQLKIKFGFKYYISYLFIMILFALITAICSFLFKNEESIYKILFYLLMSICFFGFLLATLYYYQFAIISENQIAFKSLLCTFGSINISDVKAIKKESLVTFKNAFGHKGSCDWIVFYTNNGNTPKNGLNKKNKPPFMIPFDKDNLMIIKQLFQDKIPIDL